MSWRPLDIFKSEDKTSIHCDSKSGNSDISSNENTVRSLFVNSSVAKSFSERFFDPSWHADTEKIMET